MKLPWSNPSEKSSPPLIALSQLPIAAWGKTDPATLVRDGYSGNAVVYRCVRMIAEAAASIAFRASDEDVQSILLEPSADEAGQTLFERLYTDIQITGNAWLEAVTLPEQSKPRALFGLRPDAVRVCKDKVGQVTGYGVKLKRGERIIVRDPDGWAALARFSSPARCLERWTKLAICTLAKRPLRADGTVRGLGRSGRPG